jgi:hypothetical protein
MRCTHGDERVELRLQIPQRALQRRGKPGVLALRERGERQAAYPRAQRERLVARARSRGT